MRQLLHERNKELAALMIKKTKQNGKLDDKDSEAYEAALARFNARANANRRRASKKNIDWESGKDARAEGHIARATRGVKKEKKGAAEKAARAHGDVKEWKRLTSNGELINEGNPWWLAAKALAKKGVKWLGRKSAAGAAKLPAAAGTAARKTVEVGTKAVRKTALPVGGAATMYKGVDNLTTGAKEMGTAVANRIDPKGRDARMGTQNKADTPTQNKADTPTQKKADTPTTTSAKPKTTTTTPKKKGGFFKDKDGNWTTGAKVAGAVGGAYVAKKTLDAFKDDK